MEKKRNSSIKATKNGPYIASEISNFKISKYDYIKTSKTMVMCRCGHSGGKPFCDGAYWYIEFKHDESNIPLEKRKETEVKD